MYQIPKNLHRCVQFQITRGLLGILKDVTHDQLNANDYCILTDSNNVLISNTIPKNSYFTNQLHVLIDVKIGFYGNVDKKGFNKNASLQVDKLNKMVQYYGSIYSSTTNWNNRLRNTTLVNKISLLYAKYKINFIRINNSNIIKSFF